jgi:2-oxo-3-hexenedioate decarboxylase/2-keto-4-pentenoate hydratase
LQRARLDRLPADCVPSSEAEAYAVQDLLHRSLTAGGWGSIAGYKIGCTTPVMQAYLGIHTPCAGGVFAPTAQRERGRFSPARFLRLGVECEIAVQLRGSLTPAAAPFDRPRVAAAVGGCMAAIEVVEDRYVDYPSLDTPTLIADDFFGAGCVLGSIRCDFDPFDLPLVTATMAINGQRVGAGAGTDVLGHPLDALVWLANNMAARGCSLNAGEFVLLGSLVQTHWVGTGDEVVIVNEPLGEVRATFT